MTNRGQNIKERYETLNEVFTKIGYGLFMVDKNRRILFMNGPLLFQYGNHIGRKCHDLFFNYPHPCEGCTSDKISKSQEFLRQIDHDKDKFGRFLEMTCVPTAAFSEETKADETYFIGIMHDITTRKKLEDAIRDKNLELKQKNEELETFVYTVSHDLKSPIFSLQGIVNVLIEDYANKLDGDFRDFLEDIRKSSKKMEYLIKDLLNLSRVGRTRNPRVEVPSKEIIDEAIEQLRFQIQSKGIDLKITGDLPLCFCDRQLIITALANLLDNAIKFCSINPASAIEVGCTTDGEYQVFSVKDNGIGIDPKYNKKIFEIFQTLNEIKDPRSTGVGLAIVKKIVDVHMGRVWVESEKGKGATFFFTLPSKASVQPDVQEENE